MVLFPEKENIGLPKEIQATPDSPTIPEHIEKTGVSVPPTTFTAQVTDNSGQPVITPTASTIQIPADQTTLTSQSKGSITSSLTWLAAFWLRMIKKAMHLGSSIVVGRTSEVVK